MGFYHLDLDALSKWANEPVESLKTRSYGELEELIAKMQADKIKNQNRKNAEDIEYERLVLKYLEPMGLLSPWFDEREIILACAHTGVTDRDLCSTAHCALGQEMADYNKKAEFLRESKESVDQFDAHGRRLAEPKWEMRRVYRVTNPYQGLRHGPVILDLLYGRYPALQPFAFSAYSASYDRNDSYEIYAKNSIYVPFTALMTGNVDAVIYRNRTYWKWYSGKKGLVEAEERLRSEEGRALLSQIQAVGEQERILGHHYQKERPKDAVAQTVEGLTIWWEPPCKGQAGTPVYLEGEELETAGQLLAQLRAWAKETGQLVRTELRNNGDFFGEQEWTGHTGFPVQTVFAWKDQDAVHVVIRTA